MNLIPNNPFDQADFHEMVAAFTDDCVARAEDPDVLLDMIGEYNPVVRVEMEIDMKEIYEDIFAKLAE